MFPCFGDFALEAARNAPVDHGHRFVTDLVEAFPGEIDAVSIAKPSLEDVFIRRTGHRFWSEETQSAEEKK